MQSEKTNVSAKELLESIKDLIPDSFPGCVTVIVSELDDNGMTGALVIGKMGAASLQRTQNAFDSLIAKASLAVLEKILGIEPEPEVSN